MIWQKELILPICFATKETEVLGNNKFSVKSPQKVFYNMQVNENVIDS